MSGPVIFNHADLDVGDLLDFEEITGCSIDQVFTPTGMKMSAKVVLAIVYIVKRRENPGFTLDDARKVKFSELQFVSDEVDPTSGGVEQNGSTPSPLSVTSGG